MGDFLKLHFSPNLAYKTPLHLSLLEGKKPRAWNSIRDKVDTPYLWGREKVLIVSSYISKVSCFLNRFQSKIVIFLNHSIHFHLCSWATRIEWWVLEFHTPHMRGMWAMVTWFLILECCNTHIDLYIHVHLFLPHFFFSFLLIHHLEDRLSTWKEVKPYG